MSYPTSEEKELILKYALLPHLLEVFKQDRSEISSILKTNGPYIDLIDQAFTRVENDLIATRKAMREADIKVYQEKRTESGVELKYKVRGYHHVAVYKWDFVKLTVDELVSEYLSNSIKEVI